MKNIEYKKKILWKLANNLRELSQKGVIDQYPINLSYVAENIEQNQEEIISQISKDFKTYHELKLSQSLLLLFNRKINVPNKLINGILDELIKRRVDPTLEKSLDLKKYPENNLKEIEVPKTEIKKYILYAELNTDISYPIFRGFGFNIYTKGNRFYKEFELNGNKFMYSAKIIKAPEYLMSGHNRKNGEYANYKFYGTLPKTPFFRTFKSKKSKIEYATEKILKNLNVKINPKKEIIVPKKVKPKKLGKEEKKKATQGTYKFLISKVE